MKTTIRSLAVATSLAAASIGVAQNPPPPIPQPPAPQPPINVPAYPQGQAVPVQPPMVVQQPPVVIPTPPVMVPVLPAPTPLTIGQAERALRGLPPGHHRVLFIHPVTGCVVPVTFRICGCITDIRCGKFLGVYRLTFKVKGFANDVVIKFKPNGNAVVVD
jgi:hypothetical protein